MGKKENLQNSWAAGLYAANSAILKDDVTSRRIFCQDFVASLERHNLLPVLPKKRASKRAKEKYGLDWFDYYTKKCYRDLGVPE